MVEADQSSGFDWRPYIVCDPKILCGKPTLKGTRLAVEFVLDLLAGDWDDEVLRRNYPGLTPERKRAVLAYAADFVREIHALPLSSAEAP